MNTETLYDQVALAIAQLNPEKVLTLKAPLDMQQKFDALIEKSKTSALLSDEKDDLDHFIVLERLIRLAKIHAKLQLLKS